MIKNRFIPYAIAVTVLLFCQAVSAQDAPSPQQALQNFGIAEAQMVQLERGEIVSYEVSETSQKELAIGVAMILPTPLPQIVNYIKKGNLTSIHSDIIATANLPANATVESFKKFAFTDKYADEAKAFLQAEPGDEFNLSKQEFE